MTTQRQNTALIFLPSGMFIICIDDSVSPQGWFTDIVQVIHAEKKKPKPAESGLLVFTVQQAVSEVLEGFWTVVNQLDTRLVKFQDQINQVKLSC